MNAEYIEPGIAVADTLHRTLCRELQLKRGGQADNVLQFMVAFGQLPRARSERIPEVDFALARKLLVEEYEQEYVPAFDACETSQSLENLTDLVDAACDVVYVILWAMNKFNIPFDKCFAEVQRSNMAKLNEDGTYTKNAAGKVQKPATWTPPDLFNIMADHYDTAKWVGGMRRDVPLRKEGAGQ